MKLREPFYHVPKTETKRGARMQILISILVTIVIVSAVVINFYLDIFKSGSIVIWFITVLAVGSILFKVNSHQEKKRIEENMKKEDESNND